MRKLCLIGLMALVGTMPLHAQGGLWRRLTMRGTEATAPAGWLENINISRQLSQRVRRTYQQARSEQKAAALAYKTMPFGEPANGIFHTGILDPHVLYPDQPFLTTSRQTGKYLLARNNVLMRNELRKADQLRRELDQALPTLEQIAQQLEQPAGPQEFALWSLKDLSPEVNYLFIGEEHGYADIREMFVPLVRQVRTQQPDRQIVFFTEFLPSQFKWNATSKYQLELPNYLTVYYPKWEQLLELQIPVIGLEPKFAQSNQCWVRQPQTPNPYSRPNVWETLEGVRLRNEDWIKTLNDYRAQLPDALFIIYTGADHCMYNRPFALPTNYEPERCFVITLHPATRKDYKSAGFLKAAEEVQVPASGPLERLTERDKFPQSALKWNDPALSHVTGFDVRLKIPITR